MSRCLLLLLTVLPVAACTAPEAETHLTVLDTLVFGREIPEGHSLGFDLDGRVSDEFDAAGCGVTDLAHAADGTAGIDNAFGSLFPSLEAVGGDAIEGLIQDAINSGELLMMLQVDGIDDFTDDDAVGLQISQGIGLPEVGTHGLIESGQTFDPDEESPVTRVEDATITDGVLSAGGFNLPLQLQVFATVVDLLLLDGRVHLEFDEAGGTSGYIGGGIAVEQIVDLATSAEESLADTIVAVMDIWADLAPNPSGDCQQLSATVEFSAVTAFYFAEDVD